MWAMKVLRVAGVAQLLEMFGQRQAVSLQRTGEQRSCAARWRWIVPQWAHYRCLAPCATPSRDGSSGRRRDGEEKGDEPMFTARLLHSTTWVKAVPSPPFDAHPRNQSSVIGPFSRTGTGRVSQEQLAAGEYNMSDAASDPRRAHRTGRHDPQ